MGIDGFLSNLSDVGVRAVLNIVFASLFCGSISHILLNNVSRIVVNAMDIIFFCYAVEIDNLQKQERFEQLYDNIVKSIQPGYVPTNPGITAGNPPTEHIMVQIPADALPGSKIQVQVPDGQMVQVLVPPGAIPGTSIQVQIPPTQPVAREVTTPLPVTVVGQPLPNNNVQPKETSDV